MSDTKLKFLTWWQPSGLKRMGSQITVIKKRFDINQSMRNDIKIDTLHTIKHIYCGNITTKLQLEQNLISHDRLKNLVFEEYELSN